MSDPIIELMDDRDDWKERAEKAERQLAEEREWFAIARRGLDEKNARLAELARRMREWAADTNEAPKGRHWAAFDRLLTEYEGGEHD